MKKLLLLSCFCKTMTSTEQIGLLMEIKTLVGTNIGEQEVLDLIESNLLRQAIEFPTCSKKILEVALCKICHIHAEKFEVVEKIYNCSDHAPIRLTLEVPQTKKNTC